MSDAQLTSSHLPSPDDEMVIIRLAETRRLAGISRSAIYQRTKDGSFPAPINLGGRSVGWLRSEVVNWVKQRVRESRAGTQNTSPEREAA